MADVNHKLDAGPYWGNQGIDPNHRPLDPLTAAGWNVRQPEVDALRAENERLRAALRSLLAYTVKTNVYTDRSPTIHEAEDALGDDA